MRWQVIVNICYVDVIFVVKCLCIVSFYIFWLFQLLNYSLCRSFYLVPITSDLWIFLFDFLSDLCLFLLFFINRMSLKSNLYSGSTWTLEIVSIGSCSNRISSGSAPDLILLKKSRISCWSLSLNRSSPMNMSSVVAASFIFCLLSGSPCTSSDKLL